jgi:hypothetical protein
MEVRVLRTWTMMSVLLKVMLLLMGLVMLLALMLW